MSKLEQQ